jgi:hypothetical protein
MGAARTLFSAVIYSAFAAAVFLAHGNAPDITVDHVTYLKGANEIIEANPDGFYARDLTSITSYGVLLAYLHEWTRSHILSLKLLLAVFTVFHLFSTEVFFRLLTREWWKAVLFSLLAAFFVSFGAPIWGVTDFIASLNRSIVVPFMILIVYGFVAWHDRPWKYLAYPLLVALSVLHLSVYYLLLTLIVYEAWDFAIERRLKLDRRLLWFAAGLLLAFVMTQIIEAAGIGVFKHVFYTLGQALTAGTITPAESWKLELYVNPWRNMPLPLTTLAAMAASFGLIGLLALAGLGVSIRRGLTQLDRRMLAFGAAVVVASYGPQTLMWLVRSVIPIYPVNFEEMRAISLVMLPALYFVLRLFESAVADASLARNFAASAVISALVLLQPIVVLRSLPDSTKEAILRLALEKGLILEDDSLRLSYARQFLGLPEDGPRFYYSIRNAIAWLDLHAAEDERVLSDRNDLMLAKVEVIGDLNSLQKKGVTAGVVRALRGAVEDVHRAFRLADMRELERVGRKYGATFAVVPWPVEGAAYRDRHFSIIRIPAEAVRAS